MKKMFRRLVALLLVSSLMLSGCSTASGEKQSDSSQTTADVDEQENLNEIEDLVIPKIATSELSTFNILYSELSAETQFLTNMWDALLEADSYGRLVPAIAEDWGTEDNGLSWTFKIRDGVKWVDVDGNEKADCTSYDFATGMEWVLNFYKNESAHTSQPMELIDGAKEYYEYTKTLTQEEAYALTAGEGSKFQEMVGISTPDEHTITYRCVAEKTYFDTVAIWAGMYPLSQAMVDELGVDGVKSMNNENMWYNGCYLMTTFVPGNEKVFTKNPKYWDQDCKRFNTVTIKMVESNDIAFQMYQSGELDYVSLTESNVNTINGDENNTYHNQMIEWPTDFRSYQFHFNYDKRNEDGTPDENWNTAIANEAFRLCWYYGLDLTPYFSRTNAVNPMSCENNFYSMKGLIYTSNGTDYTELIRKELGLPEANGETPARLDTDKLAQYKQQAIKELTDLGVTFPVMVDHYIAASNQAALDSANVLKQAISDSLGDDFVQMNIKTYVSSASQEVYNPKLQSINISGWGADYGDPQNYLGQETYGNDTAYYTKTVSNINDVEENEKTKDLLDTYKEYTSLVEAADAIHDDMDARLEAYAKAEAYMIQHVLTMPAYYNIGWVLTKINPYSKMKAMFGCQNEKMKNWETNAEGYTTEEMEKIAAEHEANQ